MDNNKDLSLVITLKNKHHILLWSHEERTLKTCVVWRYRPTLIKSNQPMRAVSLIARVAGRERERAREKRQGTSQQSVYLYQKNLVGCHTTSNARLSGFLPIHNFPLHLKTPNYLTAWEPDSRADRVCQLEAAFAPLLPIHLQLRRQDEVRYEVTFPTRACAVVL